MTDPNPLIDNHKQQGLRRKLIEVLKQQGITHDEVIRAMSKVPRHYFLESVFESHAYENKALPIAEGQTISQPYTVAYQTEKLDIAEDDKVLEIGTGSGYQAAVLAEMGVELHTIERHQSLHNKTQLLLNKMGYGKVKFYFGDGFKGVPSEAPFDKIIITASPKVVPQALLDQLKINGKMIVPIDQGEVHKMTLITKISANEYEYESLADFKFVPMLKGVN